MKEITEILIGKAAEELKAIASEYEIPRFKEKNKRELVNDIEILIKSPEFKDRVKEKLSIPMLNLINLIMNTKNKCKAVNKLRKDFPDYAATDLNFEALIRDLISLGVIHGVEENGSVKYCISLDVYKWMKQFRKKKISEL